jgi:hypothetical protein
VSGTELSKILSSSFASCHVLVQPEQGIQYFLSYFLLSAWDQIHHRRVHYMLLSFEGAEAKETILMITVLVTGILVAAFVVFIVWLCCCGTTLRKLVNIKSKRSREKGDTSSSVSSKIEYEHFRNKPVVTKPSSGLDVDQANNPKPFVSQVVPTTTVQPSDVFRESMSRTPTDANQKAVDNRKRKISEIFKTTEETQTFDVPRVSVATSPFREEVEENTPVIRNSMESLKKPFDHYHGEDKSTCISPDAFKEYLASLSNDRKPSNTYTTKPTLNEAYVDDFDNDEESTKPKSPSTRTNNPYQSAYSPELSGIEFPVLKKRSSMTSYNKQRFELFELDEILKPMQAEERINKRVHLNRMVVDRIAPRHVSTDDRNSIMHDEQKPKTSLKRPIKRISYLNKSPSRASINTTPTSSLNGRNFIELNKIKVTELSHFKSRTSTKTNNNNKNIHINATDENNVKKIKLANVSMDYEQTWEI